MTAGFAFFTVIKIRWFFSWNVYTLFSSSHVGQYTSPIFSCTLMFILKLNISFTLYLVDWNQRLLNIRFPGTKVIFFWQIKSLIYLSVSSSCATERWKRLSEQTTMMHTFHKREWFTEKLHESQETCISSHCSISWSSTCHQVLLLLWILESS